MKTLATLFRNNIREYGMLIALIERVALLRAIHERHGRYADAVAMANRLIGAAGLTGSQTVTIHRELGTSLVGLGRDDLAKDAFQALLAQQPDGRAHFLRGVCYFRISQAAQRVFAEYEAASRQGFNPFLVSLHRGVLHAWEQEFAQAQDEFRAALALRPDDKQVQDYLTQTQKILSTPVLRREEAKFLYFAPPHCSCH
jgi:tetratricopeptide (TPR) repeat protein